MQDFGINNPPISGYGGNIVTTEEERTKGDFAFLGAVVAVLALTAIIPAVIFGGPF